MFKQDRRWLDKNPDVWAMVFTGEVLQRVARHLPAGGVLLSWQREADKLQVHLRSEQTDPRAFVAAFEGDPVLSGVAVTPAGGGVMRLAFELPVAARADTRESDDE